MSGNGLERKIRALEDLQEEYRPEPSPEVRAKWNTKYKEAFLHLGEVAKRAFEEEGEVVYGAYYDDGGNFQGLEVDAEVDEAYERWGEVWRAARAAGVGFLHLDDDLHYGDERAEYVRQVLHSLIWDSRGNPWQGPLADSSKNFIENPPRPGPLSTPRDDR
jgi:hypothetical protein